MYQIRIQDRDHIIGTFLPHEGDNVIGKQEDGSLIVGQTQDVRTPICVLTVCQDAISLGASFQEKIPVLLNGKHVTAAEPLHAHDIVSFGSISMVLSSSDGDTGEGGIDFVKKSAQALQSCISNVIIGKNDTIRQVIVALFAEGHLLLEDIPGVGKTKLARTLAKALDTDFKRIQFTPDMLPNDITGINIYDERKKEFVFIPGPIFSNVVLADEINRGTPRVQAALLECMAEARVTIDGKTSQLQKPFFVIATQNPIDFHGTYPLPEAQLDRFLMRLSLGYPAPAEEKNILLHQASSDPLDHLSAVMSAEDLLRCQAIVREVFVSDACRDYIVTLIGHTRQHPAFQYGCSTRASLALQRACQAFAAIQGRDHVLPRDVRDLAVPVLAHRLPFRPQARKEWPDAGHAIQGILNDMPMQQWERP